MLTTAALTPAQRAELSVLMDEVRRHDGVAALDEAAVLALEGTTARHLLARDADDALVGYASVLSDGTIQGMVSPSQRRRGYGSRLLEAALGIAEEPAVWAHGALEGSLAFLTAAGLVETRRLLTLRRDLGSDSPLPEPPPSDLDGIAIGAFEVERDADRWVEVNARAFADHPEQGALTREDLDRRLAQEWFDPADMLVARQDGALVGFVWVKRERPGAREADAEIYVVATDPRMQGRGLASRLLALALGRLAREGVPGAELYVEADNAPALRLYESWGFAVRGADVQMRPRPER